MGKHGVGRHKEENLHTGREKEGRQGRSQAQSIEAIRRQVGRSQVTGMKRLKTEVVKETGLRAGKTAGSRQDRGKDVWKTRLQYGRQQAERMESRLRAWKKLSCGCQAKRTRSKG